MSGFIGLSVGQSDRQTMNDRPRISETAEAVLFCSLAVLDPRVGHTMDVLSPFVPALRHSD